MPASLGLTTPNDAESVLATCRTTQQKTGEFRSRFMRGHPGPWCACAFSVDSVDQSTPVADMPSQHRWLTDTC